MRILFDNGTPRGLARFLPGHSVVEARSRGWEELTNGLLLDAAEKNLAHRKLAIVVLQHSQWPMVKQVAAAIAEAITTATPGSFQQVRVPF